MRLGMAVLLVSCAVLPPGGAEAQSPQDGEFVANTYTTGDQGFPGVAVDAGGGFVVAWQTVACCGSLVDVRARRFDAHGNALGVELLLNAHTTGNQLFPLLAARPDGGFVALWRGSGPPGPQGTFVRVFDAEGTPSAPEVPVQMNGAIFSAGPGVGVDAAGGFVVAWSSYTGQGADIFARRFALSGAPVGGDIPVGASSSGVVAIRTGVAMSAGGEFVVAWNEAANAIAARRFDAAGQPVSGQIPVNEPAITSVLSHPLAVADAAGGFVVAWAARDAPANTVHARSFDVNGAPRGVEFVAATTSGVLGTLAADADGTFVVSWSHANAPLEGGSPGVFAQRFDRSGQARSAPVALNLTVRDARDPALAANAAGGMAAAWTSLDAADGSGGGILARRFPALRAAALAVDPGPPQGAGNGVFEPGETVAVAPEWRNGGTLGEAFTGAAAAFTGPGGPGDPTYTITDSTAAYDAVQGGRKRSCRDGIGDCYALSLSVPAARPVAHWDASFTEVLTPGAVFPQAWTLHVGGSFTDVPADSAFYRFVEAMLHRGVTAGCSATGYCPAAAVSREQMAVLLLAAKEGPGYQPGACQPPNRFDDVPEASPFCPWIEELAGRGITAGCEATRYCPAAPVTRQEMAALVLRTLDPDLQPPACTTPQFDDLPAASHFCRWVEELARRRVVAGCGGGAYCPAAPVTREQMSVFLGVTFGLTLYGP